MLINAGEKAYSLWRSKQGGDEAMAASVAKKGHGESGTESFMEFHDNEPSMTMSHVSVASAAFDDPARRDEESAE